MSNPIRHLIDTLGIARDSISLKEKLTSALGATLAITLLCLTSMEAETSSAEILLQASIGASAILIFAVPHGPLSQPWPVFGGHIISAIIGVICYQHIEAPILAAATAVGTSILMMYLGRCLHPPGGATALTAVIGGTEVHNLGFQYVLTPVLTNILVLLSSALVIHYLFQSKSYPAAKYRKSKEEQKTKQTHAERHLKYYQPTPPSRLTRQNYLAALEQMDTYIDVSVDDLTTIVTLATKHAEQTTHGSTLENMESPTYQTNARKA